MQITDNFLETKDFKKIQEYFLGSFFPWYWQEKSSHYENDFWQFSHKLYENGQKIDSPGYELLIPLFKKIGISALGRVKINLNPQTEKIIETGLHNDTDDPRFFSSVFFLDNSNGYCKIKNEKIFSKENRLVTFKSDTIHTGSTTTNFKRRLVISIIYLPTL